MVRAGVPADRILLPSISRKTSHYEYDSFLVHASSSVLTGTVRSLMALN
jgi:hypothetical protein